MALAARGRSSRLGIGRTMDNFTQFFSVHAKVTKPNKRAKTMGSVFNSRSWPRPWDGGCGLNLIHGGPSILGGPIPMAMWSAAPDLVKGGRLPFRAEGSYPRTLTPGPGTLGHDLSELRWGLSPITGVEHFCVQGGCASMLPWGEGSRPLANLGSFGNQAVPWTRVEVAFWRGDLQALRAVSKITEAAPVPDEEPPEEALLRLFGPQPTYLTYDPSLAYEDPVAPESAWVEPFRSTFTWSRPRTSSYLVLAHYHPRGIAGSRVLPGRGGLATNITSTCLTHITSGVMGTPYNLRRQIRRRDLASWLLGRWARYLVWIGGQSFLNLRLKSLAGNFKGFMGSFLSPTNAVSHSPFTGGWVADFSHPDPGLDHESGLGPVLRNDKDFIRAVGDMRLLSLSPGMAPVVGEAWKASLSDGSAVFHFSRAMSKGTIQGHRAPRLVSAAIHITCAVAAPPNKSGIFGRAKPLRSIKKRRVKKLVARVGYRVFA